MLDEQERLSRGTHLTSALSPLRGRRGRSAAQQDVVGTQRFAEIRHHSFCSGRDGLSFNEEAGLVFKQFSQHMANPCVMNRGVLLATLQPVFVGFPEPGCFRWVALVE